ncbi:MAG: hypothetical protein ACJ8C4_14210 [Gemmataceae bacterium]
MRRYLVILVGFVIAPMGIACHHVAGRCDCQPNVQPCCKYGLFTSDPTSVVAVDGPRGDVLPPPPPPPPPAPPPPMPRNAGSGM